MPGNGWQFGGDSLVREKLYPGEHEYFGSHPKTRAMAADDNRVILNPYAGLTDNARQSLVQNEMARILMRTGQVPRPAYQLTPEQQAALAQTEYAGAPEQARRETIAARLLAGDPSGGMPSGDQKAFVGALARMLMERK